ncbi:MAG: hypothetical protein LC798_14910 [Chloroflexi bacterium]|nr:hypothetical protein [Chloroflexota bacterium]
MARGPGDDEAFTLSPRARWIGGWLAAALLVLAIAVVFRVLGGNGDGTVVAPSPSGSGTPSATAITFGTALDTATGEVAADARGNRFDDGDTFAYSVPPAGTVPPTVYVEVLTAGAESVETLQEPVGRQPLSNPDVIAFTVPAADLLAVFGPGEYLMRIYADPEGDPIAEGKFELVGATVSPAATP